MDQAWSIRTLDPSKGALPSFCTFIETCISNSPLKSRSVPTLRKPAPVMEFRELQGWYISHKIGNEVKKTLKNDRNKRCKYRNCTSILAIPGFRYCPQHGKGRKCQSPGCLKYSLKGGHCIAHGGGKRCERPGCKTTAQRRGLCKLHGGRAYCKAKDCKTVSRRSGLCSLHDACK